MEDTWFTGLADELALCLVDAETCAEACESLLEAVRASRDAELQRLVADALVGPAAVARVLIELIDQPPRLVLAACRLYCESTKAAVKALEDLGRRIEAGGALTALRTSAASCERLLDAAG
jgi:hypothetical protein